MPMLGCVLGSRTRTRLARLACWQACRLCVLFATEAAAVAESEWGAPPLPLLPAFGSLCDGGPVACNRINSSVTANIRLDVMPFVEIEQHRYVGLFLPFWMSLALLERAEMGLGIVHTQKRGRHGLRGIFGACAGCWIRVTHL